MQTIISSFRKVMADMDAYHGHAHKPWKILRPWGTAKGQIREINHDFVRENMTKG